MLAILCALTIAALLASIMSSRVSPMIALTVVPVSAALVAGFAPDISKFVVDGITKIAPIAGMFIFAILFFGIMTDAGLFNPLIERVVRAVDGRPTWITTSTALLALLIHLDGSGAVCFLVTIPAMRPLYDRMGMDRRVLACTASLAAGVNFLPWTGPTIRASAALSIPVSKIFVPMIPVQMVGLCFVFAAAWWLGRREARRIAMGRNELPAGSDGAATTQSSSLARLDRLWVNWAITLAVMASIVTGVIEPVTAFMLATATALLVNYPGAQAQRERIEAHARAALLMTSILFAAGSFTGVMNGTGMIKALSSVAAENFPAGLSSHMPAIVAILSMPLSLVFDPDSYYFAVLPVLAHINVQFGGTAVQVAQASLLGQMTTGFPVSPLTPATFLVAGLSGVGLGAHQRFTMPYLFAASAIMTLAAVITGLF